METQDRTSFESEWEKAFDGAEAEVSDTVWHKVELATANTSNGKFKRRILMLQLLAAASVAFALSVAGVGVYNLYFVDDNIEHAEYLAETVTEPNDQLVQKEDVDQGDQDKFNGTAINRSEGGFADESSTSGLQENSGGDSGTASNTTSADEQQNGTTSRIKSLAGEQQAIHHVARNKQSGVLESSVPLSGVLGDQAEPEVVDRLFAFLEIAPARPTELKMLPWYSYIPTKKSDRNRNAWAGIGVSAGSFMPNASSVEGVQPSAANFEVANLKRTPSFSEEQNGQAFNMGLTFGTQLSEKWVLQSGLMYTQQQTTSTSNAAAGPTGSSARTLSNRDEIQETDMLVFTAPYDIENRYELISVPVQAGYVLLDRDVSIVLLAGVANSMLLKNGIGDKSGNFEEVSIPAGEESRYKTYQLSALVGSEISYELSSHYLISLAPQIRQSVNSVTKSDAGYSSRPTVLEVGFRLKYLF